MGIKIAIRADGNASLGMGHLIRCQSLAFELCETGNCMVEFITRNKENIGNFNTVHLETQYDVQIENNYEFQGIENEIAELQNILKANRYDVLIIDHYGVDDYYFNMVHQYVNILAYFEDYGITNLNVDLVINGSNYDYELNYNNKYKLLGREFVILRSDFKNSIDREISDICTHIAITSGGSDPTQFCWKIAEALLGYRHEIKKTIIIGSHFQNVSYLEKIIESDDSFELLYNPNMQKVMLDTDLFISGSGGTLYELAATGTPSLSYILFDDQEKMGYYMDQQGITRNLGVIDEFNISILLHELTEMLSDQNLRMRMSQNGRKLIDGCGAERAAKKIIEITNGSVLHNGT